MSNYIHASCIMHYNYVIPQTDRSLAWMGS